MYRMSGPTFRSDAGLFRPTAFNIATQTPLSSLSPLFLHMRCQRWREIFHGIQERYFPKPPALWIPELWCQHWSRVSVYILFVHLAANFGRSALADGRYHLTCSSWAAIRIAWASRDLIRLWIRGLMAAKMLSFRTFTIRRRSIRSESLCADLFTFP